MHKCGHKLQKNKKKCRKFSIATKNPFNIGVVNELDDGHYLVLLVGNDRYNNFDVRTGRDEELEEVRLEKINTILKNNFPDDAEGQKYIVSYNIYNGANDVWTLAVIKVGADYVKQ